MKIRILLIDNYDSFTYNLQDYFLRLGTDCEVLRNDACTTDELCQRKDFDALVLSPGPKRPKDAGILMEVIEAFYKQMPILGVCLGHQAIGQFFGAELAKGKVPVHGKTSLIQHFQNDIFEGIPNPTSVMRYHSLLLKNLPTDTLEATAFTTENEIMALRHRQYPLWGLQFHPESILTKNGLEILDNWLKIVKQTLKTARNLQKHCV